MQSICFAFFPERVKECEVMGWQCKSGLVTAVDLRRHTAH